MSDLSAVLAAVEAGQREAEKWASGVISETETQRDRALRLLEQARAALDGGERKRQPQAPSPKHRANGRGQRKRPATTPEAALERRQAMARYLEEERESRSVGQVRRALGFTESSTQSGLRQLFQEGKIGRTGTGPTTRYHAKGVAAAGTLQGGILSILRDRTSATLEELSQATRGPEEEVRRACAVLVREEEIRMDKRDRRTVYVWRPR